MSGRHAGVLDGATDAAIAVDAAVRAAAAAGVERHAPAPSGRGWLRALADAIEAHRDELVALAHAETHLSEARLSGEIVRTATQLRFFAGVIEEGVVPRGDARLARRVARAAPPRPAPDAPADRRRRGVRRVQLPVRVLGARQRHRLGARRGLPVVVKAHPGHPALSRRVAEVARDALVGAGAPADAVVLVEGVDEGVALVRTSAHRRRRLHRIDPRRPRALRPRRRPAGAHPVLRRARIAEPRRRDRGGGRLGRRRHRRRASRARSRATAGSTARSPASSSCRPTPGSRRRCATRSGRSARIGCSPTASTRPSRRAPPGSAASTDAEVVWRGAADEGVAPATVDRRPTRPRSRPTPRPGSRECFGPLTVLVRYEDRRGARRGDRGARGRPHRVDPPCARRGRDRARRGARPRGRPARLQRAGRPVSRSGGRSTTAAAGRRRRRRCTRRWARPRSAGS